MVVALPPIAERVRTELSRLGLSQRWLAEKAGITHQSLNQWLNEEARPRKRDVWQRLLAIVEHEADKMERVENSGGKRADLAEFQPFAARSKVRLRFAGVVPCSEAWGDPLESTEYVEVAGQFGGERRFVAKVAGDSCYPALLPGDLTVWEPDLSPPYGVIVLAQRKGDHGCTVKQLTHDGTRPRLTPINPSASAPDDGEGWGVVARLVGVERATQAPARTWFWEAGLRPEHLS